MDDDEPAEIAEALALIVPALEELRRQLEECWVAAPLKEFHAEACVAIAIAAIAAMRLRAEVEERAPAASAQPA